MNLYHFQQTAVDKFGIQEAVLCADEMGTGKSYIGTARDLEIRKEHTGKTLVIAPMSLLDMWRRMFEAEGFKVRVIDPKHRDLLFRQADKVDVFVVHWAALRLMPELFKREWLHVMCDECVVAGTLIDTPSGKQVIEDLREGDLVYSYDEDTKEVVESTVTATFERTSFSALYSVNNVTMTGNHPVWSDNHYQRADSLLDSMQSIGLRLEYAENYSSMRAVPERLSSRKILEGQKEILLSDLQEQMAMESGGIQANLFPRGKGTSLVTYEGDECQSRNSSQVAGSFGFGEQPIQESRSASQGANNLEGARLQAFDRGQWTRCNGSSTNAIDSASLADRSNCENRNASGLRVPYMLQAGRGKLLPEGGNRSRWSITFDFRTSDSGSKEGCFPGNLGVEDISLYEPRNYDRPRLLHNPGTRVYNIETTVGNYFANGLLVHNCHHAQNRQSQQTVALKRITGQFRTGLSGTPVTNTPDKLWSILNWLHPKEFASYWRFYGKFVDFEVDPAGGFRKIKGPKNVEVLHSQIESYYIRRLKAEVLPQLPNKYWTDIEVDLTPKQQKAYDEMCKNMITWLGDAPLVAPVVIAQLQRLQQFSNAYAMIGPDGKLTLTEPSSKLDALMELIECQSQIVVFSQYAQMADLLECRLKKAKLSYVRITGSVPRAQRQQAVDTFQAGKAQVFIGTIAAGGEGVTLTAASCVVFLDRSYSPAMNSQAEDRLHRITQKNAVQVIDIMSKNTTDAGRKTKLELKAEWLRQLLGDNLH